MSATEQMEYRQMVVEKIDGRVSRQVKQAVRDQSGPGDVLIRTRYSSLNFKDALTSEGHPGVVRDLPQVPGIDCVGEIVESTTDDCAVGENVIVGHADFGTSYPGGWSEYVSVPSDWVLPLPAGLSELDAATLGTAGFTAAGCVEALQRCLVTPDKGKVIVSGATGGVGILAVKLLSKLGYHVVASSGKGDKVDWLKQWGAAEVIDREPLNDQTDRPLLKGGWAGGVDTVGGNTLATMIRSTCIGGAVAACGVVAGADLPLTVYPFILRGVSLCGIDSANTERQNRRKIWGRLAGPWKLEDIRQLAKIVSLNELESEIQNILAGKIAGRIVVDLRS